MNNILTHQDFANLKNIGNNYDVNKVEQCISGALIDLKKTLGNGFYFDLQKNANEADYSDLIEGCQYEDKDGYTVQHEGVKSLLADYTYSRYLYEINNSVTPFGMVQKQYQDGEQVDRNMIKDLVSQNNQDAAMKWQLIEGYLNQNASTFEVWARQNESHINNDNNSFNNVKFTFLPSQNKRL
ncbi:DUF6712 family protein [Zunongwangia atlantica]|uniref:Uncharacterized protein n=1 Tax=Zunongwangia atlantica 22II14-10F7 TaxID=1185767 RepID=A0A1Y1T480_9FLAO|nr:hypothetical protein [Zunongwangia atlantica]ORL45394.1 hypothetical protein IIF7_11248 [Zunongwangia atlantica 22II14-10F7]